MLQEVDWGSLAAILAVYLLGGFVKGALGFGLPLVAISLLPLVVPVDMALMLNAVVIPLSNLNQLLRAGRAGAAAKRFWPLGLGLAIGIPVGALLISAVTEAQLTLALGLVVVLFTVLSFVAPRLAVPAAAERPVGVGVGVGAGVVGAMTSANGPVFVMYLVGLKLERALYMATLAWLFLLTGLLISGAYWSLGWFTMERLMIGVLCLVPAFAGMWVGDWAANRLSAERFRMLVIVALFVLGVNLIRRALTG